MHKKVNPMSRHCFFFISLLILTACAAPAQTLPTTPPQDNSLAKIELDAIVIQTGDLPPIEGSVEKIFLPSSDGNRPRIVNSFARLIKKGDIVFGSIYVDIYAESTETKKAYDDGANNLRYSAENENALESPSVGEHALLEYSAKAHTTVIVFVRCHAYVNISLPASKEATLDYAKRLDARLTPLVCL